MSALPSDIAPGTAAAMPATGPVLRQVVPVGRHMVSIIVPALNEAPNLQPLGARIAAALAGIEFEIIIVDDSSTDGTPGVCAALSQLYPLRLITRESPLDGLSGAVIRGLNEARGEWLVVMDADLQHPPESIPGLLAPLENGTADFVLGSRYVEGGSTEDGWGLFRKLNSSIATLLARPVAGKTRDPMSGFFALHRETFRRAAQLTPLGYKIALELICKCGVDKVCEVPIHFGNRHQGESKLSLRQQLKYIEHLSRLYDFQYPRLIPILKFAVVTSIGWSLALGVYMLLLKLGLRNIWTPVLSYPVCIATTALFHARYLRAQRDFRTYAGTWLDFWVIAMGEWFTCAIAAMWITARVYEYTPREMFVLTFAAAALARYVLRKEMLQDLRGLRQKGKPATVDPPHGSDPLDLGK